MAVEIRELTIKTSIVSRPAPASAPLNDAALAALKQRIVRECLEQLRQSRQTNNFDR